MDRTTGTAPWPQSRAVEAGSETEGCGRLRCQRDPRTPSSLIHSYNPSDFNGDGKTDILFENAGGTYASWDLNGTHIAGGGTIGNPGAAWHLAGIADLDHNGTSDIIFENTSGTYAAWLINDTTITSGATLGNVGTAFKLV